MKKVGYIGNYYKIPEYIYHSNFCIEYVIVEGGYLSDELLTFLKVREIPYFVAKNSDELVYKLKCINVDFWITCSYGKRIPIEKIPNLNIYNIHYAALPYFKGRHPTFYATIANEKSIGISLHKVTERLDEGEIVCQKFVPYYLWEDENILFDKLTDKVPELLEALDRYIQGFSEECIKNSGGDYYSPVSLADYTIDLENDSPAVIYNKVRAQAKYKGALLKIEEKQYWVNKVLFSKEKHTEGLCIEKEDYYIIFFTNK